MKGDGGSDDVFNLSGTMAASAIAGMCARVPCHPIDTVKARLQVGVGYSRRGFFSVLGATARMEGLRGLYRGFGVVFLGSAPAACMYFTTYELCKVGLPRLGMVKADGAVNHLFSGLIAEIIACILYVPIDVLKERMQVQPLSSKGKYPYRNGAHAANTVLRTEGIVGFYRAYGATIMSFGPFSALYFTFYEELKSRMSTRVSAGANPPFLYLTMCGAAAGAGAAFFSNPLDLVKLRMQVQRSSAVARVTSGDALREFGYRNMLDGITKVVRNEGLGSLFKGAGARMAFAAPSTAISMGCYEYFKSVFL